MSATFDKCLHLCQVAERNSAVERRPGELCLVGASIEEQLDRVEAAEPGQNAKGGFLVAAFWISRTYVPVLYLMIALPLAQQIAFSGGETDFNLAPKRRWLDVWKIVAICIASIVVIAGIAYKLK